MSNTVHAFDYLAAPQNHPPAAICVVFGNEPFLKRLARNQLHGDVLGEEAKNVPFSRLEGSNAAWGDLVDELSTVALFGPDRRLIHVEEADSFVSKNREELETYASHPSAGSVLVLEVQTWQSNTRLFKLVDKSGLQIACRAPEKSVGRRKQVDRKRLLDWLADWTQKTHDATLTTRATETLFELVGTELGLVDQELAKLALFAGPGGKITPELVQDVSGGWREKKTWDMIDAAADGDAADALEQLDQLLQAGEHPVGLLAQMASTLRRFAGATRLIQQAERAGQKADLREALKGAKVPGWKLESAERQLRQLGRLRAGSLYRQLLDVDLALKGTHSSPSRARTMLEQLVVRLSKQVS